jgi:hypothetical protein
MLLSGSNKKSSAVKRILSEARELEADGSREYCAAPLEVCAPHCLPVPWS